MTGWRDKLRYEIERAGVIACYLFLAWTPLRLARAVATGAADVWRLLERRKCGLAVENVMRCLGLDRRAAERVVRDNYRHLAYAAVEVARMARIGPDAAARNIDPDGVVEHIGKTMAAGRGMVMLSGHLGNWELGCLALSRYGSVGAVIAKTRPHSYLHSAINRLREISGVEVWEQNGAMRKAVAAVRKGQAFLAVVDEDVGDRGMMAPFFDRDASTFPLPVQLAVRLGAPLIVTALVRDGDLMRFRGVWKKAHWPNPDADPREETMRLLTAANRDLADIIREYPEQWHWRKNRWKTRPPEPAVKETHD